MGKKRKVTESLPGLWQTLRHFAPYAGREKPLVAGAITALVASVLLRLAEPWPLKFVLDRVVPADAPAGLHSLPWIDDLSPTALIAIAAVALVAMTLLRAMCDYYRKVGFSKIGNRVLRRVRDEVFLHVQRLSVAFHARSRRGDMLVRVTRDVSLLRDVTATALLPMLANVLVLVGMVTTMLLLHWQLALVAFAAVPLFALSTIRTGGKIHEVARKQRRREGAMASTAAESIDAIESVQALGLEDAFRNDFSNRNAQSQKEDLKGAKLAAGLNRTVDVLTSVATALVLFYGSQLILDKELTPGDLIVFLAYLKRAFNPIKDFAKYSARLAKGAAAGERVLALLGEVPDVRDAPDARPAPALRGDVRLDAVDFSYLAGHPVLAGVDLHIAPGETVAFVGASGIGKSTLLGLVPRLHDPDRGVVRLDGHDVREFTLRSLRGQISVVLQETVLFAASVADNIALGTEGKERVEIEAAARLARADEFIRALPEGYDTVVGERGATLSHGQRQRVSIARAALRDTPILLLDEPTTGLDEENERVVIDALLRLATARTTLIVTHDYELARRADRVVVLADGGIVEQGPPAELAARGGAFARLFESGARGAGARAVRPSSGGVARERGGDE